MLTIVKLCGVKDEPKAVLDLPALLRVGDPIALGFRLERLKQGRQELLEVSGRFRVAAVGVEFRNSFRQLLSVEAIDKPPTWRAVKKTPHRKTLPAKFPKTVISDDFEE